MAIGLYSLIAEVTVIPLDLHFSRIVIGQMTIIVGQMFLFVLCKINLSYWAASDESCILFILKCRTFLNFLD